MTSERISKDRFKKLLRDKIVQAEKSVKLAQERLAYYEALLSDYANTGNRESKGLYQKNPVFSENEGKGNGTVSRLQTARRKEPQ